MCWICRFPRKNILIAFERIFDISTRFPNPAKQMLHVFTIQLGTNARSWPNVSIVPDEVYCKGNGGGEMRHLFKPHCTTSNILLESWQSLVRFCQLIRRDLAILVAITKWMDQRCMCKFVSLSISIYVIERHIIHRHITIIELVS